MEKILELKKEQEDHKIFYRYKVGPYTVWFEQYQDNGEKQENQNLLGCIFSVGVHNEDSERGFNILVRERLGGFEGFPNEFQLDDMPHTINMDDLSTFIQKIQYAGECLKTIKDLFYNSEHYELYAKRLEKWGKTNHSATKSITDITFVPMKAFIEPEIPDTVESISDEINWEGV